MTIVYVTSTGELLAVDIMAPMDGQPPERLRINNQITAYSESGEVIGPITASARTYVHAGTTDTGFPLYAPLPSE